MKKIICFLSNVALLSACTNSKQKTNNPEQDPTAALTDKLNLDELKRGWEEEFWNETDFTPYSFSPDKTKILFSAGIWQAVLTMGPFCISNIDGSKQMILEQTSTYRVLRLFGLKTIKLHL